MDAGRPPDEQRLAFGRVAELYAQARPSYPDAAIDAVLEFGALRPPARVLEVGAGTGKATVLLAARGLRVLALEPSPEMARLARAACRGVPGVEVVEQEFERWRPAEPLAALVSAAAWHWLDPGVRYRLAQAALAPGGTLAALWTFPDWDACALRGELSAAYRRAAPALAPDFPMHPDSEPTRLAGDWPAEIAAAPGFTAAEVRDYPWRERYDADRYCRLLQTHQDHILLGAGHRAQLLTAVAGAIEAGDGLLELPLVTYVCLARRR